MVYKLITARSNYLFYSLLVSISLLAIQGCTAVNTFPAIARAGDTISIMVGGSENARKDTINVTLTDNNGTPWDLQALNNVRSVFNLRADGRAKGSHYSPYLDSVISWTEGHEPVQTVLVADIPVGVAIGAATMDISLNVADNSSGIADPFTVNLDIIAGTGLQDDFLRKSGSSGSLPADFTDLEPAPHAKIHFGTAGPIIGAVSLILDFDETVVNPDDINVYIPESTVRGSFVNPGAFGATQRMAYWRQDGQQLFVDVIAPQGIKAQFLKIYAIHPDGLTGPINFNLVSNTAYDLDGSEIIVPATLEYYQ